MSSSVTVSPELRAEIEAHMALYPDSRSAALPALEAAQRVHGWCSPEAIEQTASVMGVTPAYLAAVATFYDMLETEPVGRHSIYVCTNISCSLRGADALHAAVREAAGDDPEFNVRSFECLGACDIAPMASVDGVFVGPLTLEDVPQLLADVRSGGAVLADKQLSRRPVADPNANSREFPSHPVETSSPSDFPGGAA
jgi:NADH-quinone oxidoreductase subunit E